MGLPSKLFNVGSQRRKAMCDERQKADFFDTANADATRQREVLASAVLEELLDWIAEGGKVAVFDATNTTEARRSLVLSTCRTRFPELNVIFVESICTDAAVLHSNMMQKIAHSPDYRGMPQAEALADLQARIANYERVYQPIPFDAPYSHVVIMNMQSKIICNDVHGTLGHAFVSLVMSLHILPRPIYLVRSGDTEAGAATTPGPHARTHAASAAAEDWLLELPSRMDHSSHELTDDARAFQLRLGAFLAARLSHVCPGSALAVHASTNTRALRTIDGLDAFLPATFRTWSTLGPMDTGLLRSLSADQVAAAMPAEYDAWCADPFANRAPGGESGMDVARRLAPFVVEIERQRRPVLVVSHATTLHVIHAYFEPTKQGRPLPDDWARHTVLELRPTNYGWCANTFDLSNAACDPVALAAERTALVTECKYHDEGAGAATPQS